MAGKIKKVLDEIIAQRSRGNSTMAMTTKTKIIMKGINPDQYLSTSPDDPVVLDKVRKIAEELGVQVAI